MILYGLMVQSLRMKIGMKMKLLHRQMDVVKYMHLLGIIGMIILVIKLLEQYARRWFQVLRWMVQY